VDGWELIIADHTNWTIAGRVADYYDSVFPEVGLAAGDGQQTSVDASGIYTLTNLTKGAYTITATLPGYSIWPAEQSVKVPPDIQGVNFTIMPAPQSITVTPGIRATLIVTDAQGYPTALDFPTTTVTQTTVITLTPTLIPSAGDWTFLGNAFDLTAYQENQVQDNLTFLTPVTATIHYSDQAARTVSDEAGLTLMTWQDNAWTDNAYLCEPISNYERDTTGNTLVIPICQTGRYALLGPTERLLLPLANR
jgi:hypothetical protein